MSDVSCLVAMYSSYNIRNMVNLNGLHFAKAYLICWLYWWLEQSVDANVRCTCTEIWYIAWVYLTAHLCSDHLWPCSGQPATISIYMCCHSYYYYHYYYIINIIITIIIIIIITIIIITIIWLMTPCKLVVLFHILNLRSILLTNHRNSQNKNKNVTQLHSDSLLWKSQTKNWVTATLF